MLSTAVKKHGSFSKSKTIYFGLTILTIDIRVSLENG